MSKLFTTLKHLEQRQKKSGSLPEQTPPLARSSSPARAKNGKKIIAVLLFLVVSGVAAVLFLPRFLTSQSRPGINPSVARSTGGATAGAPEATALLTPKPGNREPGGTDQQTPPRRDPPGRPDHGDTMVTLPPATIRNSAGPEPGKQALKVERLPEKQKPGPSRAAGNPVPSPGKKPRPDGVELTQPTEHNPTTPGIFVSRRHKQLVQAAEESRNRGDFTEAARLYRKVWEESGDPLVANNLAASLMMLGKNREALTVLQQALEKYPGDADLQYNLETARTLSSGQVEN